MQPVPAVGSHAGIGRGQEGEVPALRRRDADSGRGGNDTPREDAARADCSCTKAIQRHASSDTSFRGRAQMARQSRRRCRASGGISAAGQTSFRRAD